MKNVDIEIYLSQLISFFEKNPNDLSKLIGDVKKEDFYKKVEEQCVINYLNDSDISLTQKQLIDIVVLLNSEKPKSEQEIIGIFQKTKLGYFCLN